ncbi:MAG: tetratricopeptide repeat protein [Bacteroidota bacterium]
MEENGKIAQLEARLNARPNSPLFARFASVLLEQGEVTRAIELCEKGIEEYPIYPTGYLIAAQCYYAAGRIDDAEKAVRFILKHHTRHTGALRFLEEIKDTKGGGVFSQVGHTQAFETFSQNMQNELSGTENTLDIDDFLAEQPESQESIEALAASLEDAKITPQPFNNDSFQDNVKNPIPIDPSIATVTLADIYERQGQYTEAIAIYQKLIEQNPADRLRFMHKIDDLQDLINNRGFDV